MCMHKLEEHIYEPEVELSLNSSPLFRWSFCVRLLMIVSPLLTRNKKNESAICNETVSRTVRRNLIILQKYPQTLMIMLNIEHFCMDLGLSANLEVDEGSCTGFITGLLTRGVVPVKVDGHFATVNMRLLFLLSETRGILLVAISVFL